jgi:hypothetical protein
MVGILFLTKDTFECCFEWGLLSVFFQQKRADCTGILEKFFPITVLYSIQEPMGHDLKFQIVIGMGDRRRSVFSSACAAGTCQKSHELLSRGFLLEFYVELEICEANRRFPGHAILLANRQETPCFSSFFKKCEAYAVTCAPLFCSMTSFMFALLFRVVNHVFF